MAILTAKYNPLESYENAKINLLMNFIGGLVVVFTALFFPKNVAISEIRLLHTFLFFVGVITIFWSFSNPLRSYLRARLSIQLEDFGCETQTIGFEYINSVNNLLNSLIVPLVTISVIIFLKILSEWPCGNFLLVASGLMTLGLWVGISVLLVNIMLSLTKVAETIRLWRVFNNQVSNSGFQLRSIESVRKKYAALNKPAITVVGDRNFEAGGIGWTWSDFQKNAIVFGETGSGKTVTVMNALLDGLLSSAGNENGRLAASALILDPKGDYFSKIQALCRKLNRLNDLMILNAGKPEQSVIWNPFDSSDDALELSERFAGVLQLLGMKNSQDTIWIDTAKQFIQHAIGLLRSTNSAETPPTFEGINELSNQPLKIEARIFILYGKALLKATDFSVIDVEELVGDIQPKTLLKELQSTYPGNAAIQLFFRGWDSKPQELKNKIIKEIHALAPQLKKRDAESLVPGSESLLAADYLSNKWLVMPEKTRGGVETYLSAMLNQFLSEPYRTIFSGKSSVKLSDVLEHGKILYVYLPVSDRSAMSLTINALIKLEFYRCVLNMPRKARPSLFLCDEFQTFFTSDQRRGDAAFFERSRESVHANLVATQNLSSLLRVVEKPEIIDNFLGNCAIKIFLRNSEAKTLEYASKHVFGEYQAQVISVGRSSNGGGVKSFLDNASINYNFQSLARVPAERIARLVTPDKESGINYSEAMIRLGSRPDVIFDRLFFKVHPLDE